MHGTSHRYISEQMAKVLNKKPNLIICHLGNGASLSAVKEGKSINTSMGLTPLAGIVMGTRSGDLDPAIIEYMCKQTNKTVEEITNSLNKESGMLALSGISSDFRDIQAAAKKGDKRAGFSIDYYAKRVADYIVMYQNDLDNDVDAIVFTAGVGENATAVRKNIIDHVKTMKVEIDDLKNTRKMDGYKIISTNDSKVLVYAMSTDEEIMIVNDLIKVAKI
jgi:acetate kinase